MDPLTVLPRNSISTGCGKESPEKYESHVMEPFEGGCWRLWQRTKRASRVAPLARSEKPETQFRTALNSGCSSSNCSRFTYL
jgi:hypothetical protein